MFAQLKYTVPPTDTDVALALADELAQLRDQLDKRTGQCLEYRALALELDEALKESERRIAELEAELVETVDAAPAGCQYCGATF